MASVPVVDATATANTASASTLSWSHTVGAGSNLALYVIATFATNGDHVGTMTYGGVSMSSVTSAQSGGVGTDRRSEIWFLKNPTPGTGTILVTLYDNTNNNNATATLTSMACESISLTNVHQGTANGTAAATSGTGTTTTLNPTLATAGALVLTSVVARSTTAPTVTGATTSGSVLGGTNTYLGYGTAAGSTTWSWSVSDVYAAIALPVNGAIVAPLTGAGTVTATGTVISPGTATLTGAGTIVATSVSTVNATASLTGAGTVVAKVTQGVKATLTGAGTTTAAALAVVPGTATLTGAGTVAATVTQGAKATLTGAGTVVASSLGTVSGTATLTGAGAVAAAGTASTPPVIVSATLGGAGSLTANATVTIPLVFRPPYRTFDPPVLPDTPERDLVPAMYFTDLIPVGVNVFVTKAGVITERQPTSWDDVANVYWGGHETPVTANEAATLVAANPEYAACIAGYAGGGTVTPPAGGGGTTGDTDFYGQSGYGIGGYGT